MNKIIRLDHFQTITQIEIERTNYFKFQKNKEFDNILSNKKYFNQDSFDNIDRIIEKENRKFIQPELASMNVRNLYKKHNGLDKNIFIYPDNFDVLDEMSQQSNRSYLWAGIYNFWASDSFKKLSGKNLIFYSFDGPFVTKLELDVNSSNGVPIQKKSSVIDKNPILKLIKNIAENINDKLEFSEDYSDNIFRYLLSIGGLQNEVILLPIINENTIVTYYKINIFEYLPEKEILDELRYFIYNIENLDLSNSYFFFSTISNRINDLLNKESYRFLITSEITFTDSYKYCIDNKIPLFYKYPDKIEFLYMGINNKEKKYLVCDSNEENLLEFGKNKEISAVGNFATLISPSEIPIYLNDIKQKDVFRFKINNLKRNDEVNISVRFIVKLGKGRPRLALESLNLNYKIINEKFCEPRESLQQKPKISFFQKQDLFNIRESKVSETAKLIDKTIKWDSITELVEKLHYILKLENYFTDIVKKQLFSIIKMLYKYKNENMYFTYFEANSKKISVTNPKIKIVDLLSNFNKFNQGLNNKNSSDILIVLRRLFGISSFLITFDGFSNSKLLKVVKGLLSNPKFGFNNELFYFMSSITYNKDMFYFYTNEFYDEIIDSNKYNDKIVKNYLWGYSRALLWFCNYSISTKSFKVKEHFIKIFSLLSYSNQMEINQSIILALIFLLTFEDDELSDFLLKNTGEISLKLDKQYLDNVGYKKMEIEIEDKNGKTIKTTKFTKVLITYLNGRKVIGMANLIKMVK